MQAELCSVAAEGLEIVRKKAAAGRCRGAPPPRLDVPHRRGCAWGWYGSGMAAGRPGCFEFRASSGSSAAGRENVLL